MNIAIIKAIVIPEPPICKYASNDPLVHKYGKLSTVPPLAMCSAFASNAG